MEALRKSSGEKYRLNCSDRIHVTQNTREWLHQLQYLQTDGRPNPYETNRRYHKIFIGS